MARDASSWMRRLAATGALALATFGGLAGVSAPAQAVAPPEDDCVLDAWTEFDTSKRAIHAIRGYFCSSGNFYGLTQAIQRSTPTGWVTVAYGQGDVVYACDGTAVNTYAASIPNTPFTIACG